MHRVVSETCVLFAVNAFWATLSGRVATVSTLLVSWRGSECRIFSSSSKEHVTNSRWCSIALWEDLRQAV